MEKIEHHVIAHATDTTPITASPIRRKTGYFKRGSTVMGTPRSRDRDRRLSALKPSRGELEVGDLQVRNIRTNDLGRKLYVVVKLCVEFPSPDVIGEMQMHVETTQKTTMVADANRADYPYTYSKFMWPGEKFHFPSVSTTHHHLLFEVWQSKLIAKDVLTGCILIPLTYFKFARSIGSTQKMTSYKWVALRPAELLDGELHVRINWKEDGQRKVSPRQLFHGGSSNGTGGSAGSPRTPRTPRSGAPGTPRLLNGTLVSSRKSARRLSMRWHHTELAKTSDEGYYDRYGFRVPDEQVEQWSFHHQHNKCRARWQYLRWLNFTTPLVELDLLGRPRSESSSLSSSSSSSSSSGSGSGASLLGGGRIARSGSHASTGSHRSDSEAGKSLETALAKEVSTGDDGAGLGAAAILDSDGRDCVDRFEYHFQRAAVTGMPAKMMELVYHGIPPCFRSRVYMIVCGSGRKKAHLDRDGSTTYYESVVRKSVAKTGGIPFAVQNQVTIDCPRTFPKTIHDTVLSTKDGELALARVLMAYAYRNKILGYCQSLNFIAGFFLCVFDEDTAFWLLTAMVEVVSPGYYVETMQGLLSDMRVLGELIKVNLPVIAAHMEETGVTVDFFATKPLMSAFVDLLPTDTLLRVFDVVFVVRSQGLLACMLAILNVGRKDFLSTTSAMEFSEVFYKTCKQQFDADFFVLKVVEMLNRSYELVRRWRAVYETKVAGQIEVARKKSLTRLIANSLEDKVDALYEQFVELSAQASCGIVDYRRLRRSEFEELLPRILAEITPTPDSSQGGKQADGGSSSAAEGALDLDLTDAFVAFDQNRDNYVDAKEFVIGLSLVYPGASFEEKVAACFRAFDLRRLNRLSIDDVAICLKWMRDFLMALDPERDSKSALKCENIDDYLEAYEITAAEKARAASQAAAAASGRPAAAGANSQVEIVVRCDAFIGLVAAVDYFAIKLNYQAETFDEESFYDESIDSEDLAANPHEEEDVDALLNVDLSIADDGDAAAAAGADTPTSAARVDELDKWLGSASSASILEGGDSGGGSAKAAAAAAVVPVSPNLHCAGLHGPEQGDEVNFREHPDGYLLWKGPLLAFPSLSGDEDSIGSASDSDDESDSFEQIPAVEPSPVGPPPLPKYTADNLHLSLNLDEDSGLRAAPAQALPSAAARAPLGAASLTPLPGAGSGLGDIGTNDGDGQGIAGEHGAPRQEEEEEEEETTTMDQQFMRRFSIQTPMARNMHRSLDSSFDSDEFDSHEDDSEDDGDGDDASFDEESSLETIQFAKDQRYPLKGEPVCVVCGRYGEYVCDLTDQDVCSMECVEKLENSVRAKDQ